MTENDADRFWNKVEKGKPDQCWEWVASVNPRSGRGQFSVDGIPQPATRVAYCLHNDLDLSDLTPEQKVVNTCFNNRCCNPAHLKLNTIGQALRRAEKHRRKLGIKRKMPKINRKGEHNPNAKLNWNKVHRIRRKAEQGKSIQEIAGEMGLKYTTVYTVVKGTHWKEKSPA